MRSSRLVLRGLIHYWRTNAAVVAGVAIAVAVLGGALLVGTSVRESLRDLVLQRLGRTDSVVIGNRFFREQLAADLRADPASSTSVQDVVPMVVVPGFVTEPESGRRAGQVRVYGVDDRFWRFHGVTGVTGPDDREILVSPALAAELGARADSALLLRVQRPSTIPLESLHGKKDGLGRTMRLTVRAVLSARQLGEFSIEAQQGDVRAVFVALTGLQKEIDTAGRVNTLLVAEKPDRPAGALERLVKSDATLDDLDLTVRTLNALGAVAVTTSAGIMDDRRAALIQTAIRDGGMRAEPVFTYLVNNLRIGDRQVPYSLVSAIDAPVSAAGAAPATDAAAPPVVLNEWAARELQAQAGDPITIEFFVWEDPGRLVTRSATLRMAGVVPVSAADRDLVPVYPGINDSPTLADWDPPFPIDLRRVRPVDEAYWNQHRTTPKAFLPLEVGQRLWRSRYGAVTSVLARPPAGQPLPDAQRALEQRLRGSLDPLSQGLAVRDVRSAGLAASRGATDFGEYFLYFSFFLVVSALLLAALFFKLSVEQRAREVGLLRAVGFGPGLVRRLFLGEGLLLALVGSAIGVLAACAYAWLLMAGLRTWWIDAVGTTALTLHLAWTPLMSGAAGGVAAACACVWWTLRSLRHVSERSLLAGQLETDADLAGQRGLKVNRARPTRIAGAVGLTTLAVVLIAAAMAGAVDMAGAFFGAGSALLGASLCVMAVLLRRHGGNVLGGHGWRPLSRLGLRNATVRTGRSVLSMAVMASATFILVSVDAFRRDSPLPTSDPHSGVGGYAVLVESLLPIVGDPNTPEGRDALNLQALDRSVTIEPFRVRPGDDASCLNLYAPGNPRILAPSDSFLAAGRFTFEESLATPGAESANPWLLLRRDLPDDVVPVIADANSMKYVLHRALGEEIVITHDNRPVRLRFVAALQDSIFQGQVLMSQGNFVRLFPTQEGFQMLLVDAPPQRTASVAAEMEDALSDFGADAVSTADRLASYHRVENTYLSTFQTLGGFGLLLGTAGMAAVLLRNVLERRRELALLAAVGYGRRQFLLMIVAENALLLAGGLAAGAISAGLAIAPAVAQRGGRIPMTAGGGLVLFAAFAIGLLSSAIAMRAATRGSLLSSLRSE